MHTSELQRQQSLEFQAIRKLDSEAITCVQSLKTLAQVESLRLFLELSDLIVNPSLGLDIFRRMICVQNTCDASWNNSSITKVAISPWKKIQNTPTFKSYYTLELIVSNFGKSKNHSYPSITTCDSIKQDLWYPVENQFISN